MSIVGPVRYMWYWAFVYPVLSVQRVVSKLLHSGCCPGPTQMALQTFPQTFRFNQMSQPTAVYYPLPFRDKLQRASDGVLQISTEDLQGKENEIMDKLRTNPADILPLV